MKPTCPKCTHAGEKSCDGFCLRLSCECWCFPRCRACGVTIPSAQKDGDLVLLCKECIADAGKTAAPVWLRSRSDAELFQALITAYFDCGQFTAGEGYARVSDRARAIRTEFEWRFPMVARKAA